jgi:phage terminase small subunit
MALSAKALLFCQEYLIDLNATQAAIRAGYSKKSAGSIGEENLKKPEIQAEIKRQMDARSERTEITQDMVLQRWWKLATADARKLIEYRRTACRYCHGHKHLYQYINEDEFNREYQFALAGAESEVGDDPEKELDYSKLPSDKGGYGYNPTVLPHPECPHCFGKGTGDVFAHDTRTLDEQTQLLYAGVKVTKEGLEIKMHDQGAALENVAKHLGMFVNTHVIRTDPLQDLLNAIDGSSTGIPKKPD